MAESNSKPHSHNFKDLIGQTFGKLTVIEFIGRFRSPGLKQAFMVWNCQCECGEIKQVRGCHLGDGHTQSCGCLVREGNSNRQHSMSSTRVFGIWCDMRKGAKIPM